MTNHEIFLIGGSDEEVAVFTEVAVDGQCRLACSYRGKVVEGMASDYFEALCFVRLELEKEGLIPFCYGASLNVFPSPMARQMGNGRSAYRLEMGKPAAKQNLVPIFAQGSDVIPAPVAQQRAYFEDWLGSLNAAAQTAPERPTPIQKPWWRFWK